MWFRRNLRLTDNEALSLATQAGEFLAIYIHESKPARNLQIGEASQVWLDHSLKKLNASLGDKLNVYLGRPIEIMADLHNQFPIGGIYWSELPEANDQIY